MQKFGAKNYAELEQNSWEASAKKYAVKMADFSKNPEKFIKEHFEEKCAFSGLKMEILKKF